MSQSWASSCLGPPRVLSLTVPCACLTPLQGPAQTAPGWGGCYGVDRDRAPPMPWGPFPTGPLSLPTALQCPGSLQPQTGVPRFHNQLWNVLTGRVSGLRLGSAPGGLEDLENRPQGTAVSEDPHPSKDILASRGTVLHKRAGGDSDGVRERLRPVCTAQGHGHLCMALRTQLGWRCKGQRGKVSGPVG